VSDVNRPLLPAIPEPVPTPESLYETVLVLKQAVELLLGHRAPKTTKGNSGVTSGVTGSPAMIVSLQEINDAFTAASQASYTLSGEITTVGAGVEANASAITALQVSFTDLQTDVDANASALTALDVRVTTNEGDITSNASAITSLSSTVGSKASTFFQASQPTATAVGDIWIESDNNNTIKRWNGTTWAVVDNTQIATTAAAVTALDTEVTSIDGELTALSTSFTGVFATTGVGDASAMFKMRAVAGPAGYDATIRLEATADGDTFGSTRAVMEMDVGTAVPSRIRFIADRLVMADAPGGGATIVEFASFSGAKIRFSTDVEIDGDLVLTGTIQTGAVAVNAITEANSAAESTHTLSSLDSGVNWTDIVSLVVTLAADEKVEIFINASGFANPNVSGNRYGVSQRLLRDATVIDSLTVLTAITDSSATESTNFFPVRIINDSPGAGTYTYKVQAQRVSVSTGSGTYTCGFLALKVKR
jgi:hypothetical protein